MKITVSEKNAKIEYGEEIFTYPLNTVSYAVDELYTSLTLFRNNERIGTSPFSEVTVGGLGLTAQNVDELLLPLFSSGQGESITLPIEITDVTDLQDELDGRLIKNTDDNQGHVGVLVEGFQVEAESLISLKSPSVEIIGTDDNPRVNFNVSSLAPNGNGGTELSLDPNLFALNSYTADATSSISSSPNNVHLGVGIPTEESLIDLHSGSIELRSPNLKYNGAIVNINTQNDDEKASLTIMDTQVRLEGSTSDHMSVIDLSTDTIKMYCEDGDISVDVMNNNYKFKYNNSPVLTEDTGLVKQKGDGTKFLADNNTYKAINPVPVDGASGTFLYNNGDGTSVWIAAVNQVHIDNGNAVNRTVSGLTLKTNLDKKANITGAKSLMVLTQAEYDAIATKDDNTIYFIKE